MVNIIKFKTEHIDLIQRQDHDLEEGTDLTPTQYACLEGREHSYSIEIKGRIVACCGLVEWWQGRGELWAVIDRNVSPHLFVVLFRNFKWLLTLSQTKRIELTVRKNFKEAHRLAQLLGFELEAPLMKHYGPTGADYSLYARTK